MKYYINAIGSLFGLFGGKKVIAVPDIEDACRIPEIHIRFLETIADTTPWEILYKNNPEMLEHLTHHRIKTEKIIDYQKRMLHANGYYETETVDFEEMNNIKREMDEDWWLQKENEV